MGADGTDAHVIEAEVQFVPQDEIPGKAVGTQIGSDLVDRGGGSEHLEQKQELEPMTIDDGVLADLSVGFFGSAPIFGHLQIAGEPSVGAQEHQAGVMRVCGHDGTSEAKHAAREEHVGPGRPTRGGAARRTARGAASFQAADPFGGCS